MKKLKRYNKKINNLSLNKNNIYFNHHNLNIPHSILNITLPGCNNISIKRNFKNFNIPLKSFYGNLKKSYLYKISPIAHSLNIPIISLIESRLDVVLFKAHFVKSIFQARNLIKHGYIKVNGKTIIYPHFLLTPGSEIESLHPQTSVNKLIHSYLPLFKTPPHILKIKYNKVLFINYPSKFL